MDIRLVPCLSDNYAYLLHDSTTNVTAVVDPAEPGPVIAALDAAGWTLSVILNTHYHMDHVGGNEALKSRYNVPVLGPEAERDKIPGIDQGMSEGDKVTLGSQVGDVIDTRAHTAGHISYYFADAKAVFVGDTMFAMGCGRLFEGSAEEMWTSLEKLMALPDDTRVYCGHEYTQSNAHFALTIEPGNTDLQARVKDVDDLRARGEPTIPTTIGLERRTSPFVRASSPEIRERLGLADARDAEVFAEVRRRKDTA